ncbi:unnamed protein product [Rotaria socialis]|uniref:AIG1-type G domain-containing protein n=1 Tax=Rotaria socialis TaxID=392032 RepID=A0A821TJ69_9BILA|nr:unnamed protein product [Rotaria socialis]CAF4872355.1 unnamed protein product [Rotaria socialis]
MASSSSRQRYGIIILGNSGVGKSFLANILLGSEAFDHRAAARSVTTETEFEEIKMGNANYAIFNIPGLIEADQQCIERNKREIDKAFVERPTSLILYVFGSQNGRIRDEDVVAFNALNKAYPLKIESLVLIVNGAPKKRLGDYEGEVIVLLKELIQVPCQSLCVLDMIDENNQSERKKLKNQLLQAIVERTPRDHIKKQDLELQREEVRKAKEEIKALQADFQNKLQMHENQIKKQQRMYDKKFDEIRNQNELMQVLIENQRKEQANQRKEQEKRDNEYKEAIQRANELTVKLRAEVQAEQKARQQAEQRVKEQTDQRAREQAEQKATEQTKQRAREQTGQRAREQVQRASKSISSIMEKLFSEIVFARRSSGITKFEKATSVVRHIYLRGRATEGSSFLR